MFDTAAPGLGGRTLEARTQARQRGRGRGTAGGKKEAHRKQTTTFCALPSLSSSSVSVSVPSSSYSPSLLVPAPPSTGEPVRELPSTAAPPASSASLASVRTLSRGSSPRLEGVVGTAAGPKPARRRGRSSSSSARPSPTDTDGARLDAPLRRVAPPAVLLLSEERLDVGRALALGFVGEGGRVDKEDEEDEAAPRALEGRLVGEARPVSAVVEALGVAEEKREPLAREVGRELGSLSDDGLVGEAGRDEARETGRVVVGGLPGVVGGGMDPL